MRYNILLIDDQYKDESIQDFMLNANFENIKIQAVGTHDEGMELILNDVENKFQAVILDATGFKSVGESDLTNTGLKYSLKILSESRKTKLVPWFVFTGAARNKDDKEFSDELRLHQEDIKFGRKGKIYYIKAEDEDKLLEDIKTEIDKLEQTYIEFNFRHVFQIAKNINIPNEDINNLIIILRSIQSNTNDLEPSLYFTQLRKYVEYIFRDAAKHNILHEKCIDKEGKVNLAESSLFLAGENTKYTKVKCAKTHFPKIIAENIKNLIFITGAASHTSEVDLTKNLNYQMYREQIKTPYLLYQLTFKICDLLVWYDNYLKSNNDKNQNKSLWIENDNNWIEGFLKEIQRNGYGTFQPNDDMNTLGIIPDEVVKNQLTEGCLLKVRTEQNADGTKTYIKEIIKI